MYVCREESDWLGRHLHHKRDLGIGQNTRDTDVGEGGGGGGGG